MDFLPQEILIEILRNVDRGKKQLCLVSKSFYNAFSSLNEDVWLVINWKILDDESTYKDILETTRRIRNIEMKMQFDRKSENKEKQVLRIIEKQSNNITQLVLNGSFSQEFLEEVFKLIPKLNLLDLKKAFISRFDSSSPAPSKKMKMSEPEKLNLRQVKKLILCEITSYTSKYILDLMNNLDHGTLNQLEVVIKTQDYTRLHEFIEKQPNLKVLKLVQSYSYIRQNENVILPPTFLSNCDLKCLEWEIRYGTIDDAQREIVNSILKRMKNLTELKLFHRNDSLEYSPTQRFNIITGNLKKLETLEIDVRDIDDTTIVNLNDLTKLRNLTLDFNHLSHQMRLFSLFDQVTLPQLKSFTTLEMSYVNNNVNCFERMSTTFLQDVKKLKIQIPQNMGSFQSIFQYFPEIESLTIHKTGSYAKFRGTFPSELQNSNLKELITNLMVDCSTTSIRELTECFPNIEKLSLRCIGLGDSGLNLLLRNLRMLKYLELYVPYANIISFDKRMNSILKHGQNLEVVVYRAKFRSSDILNIFENKFEYIQVTGFTLVMAVNEKILNSYPREYYY